MSISLTEFLENQQELEKQAAEEYPWDPEACTFHLDVGRQHLYACRTCKGPNAICYACSIHCHTDHDLVEVGSKRDIKCDCGTTRIGGDPCSLRKIGELEKPDPNEYCHNFEGKFCECDSEYNDETMYQCRFGVACKEDWFHEKCLPTTEPIEGALICWKCVEQTDLGFLADSPIVVKTLEKPTDNVPHKRKRGQFSLVLVPDFDEHLSKSKDERVKTLLSKYPFLGEDETEYEKIDEHAQESLLDSGMRALANLDRTLANKGIEQINHFQNKFLQYFESWDSSKAVTDADIQEFFRTIASKS